MGSHKTRIAVSLIMIQSFTAGFGVLNAFAGPNTQPLCAHHTSNRECSMDECPMRQDASAPDHGAKLDCPTDSASAGINWIQQITEGPIANDFKVISSYSPWHLTQVVATPDQNTQPEVLPPR